MNSEYDSWHAYEAHCADVAMNARGDDRNCYIPSPDDIVERCRNLRWLQNLGFASFVIESVLVFEHPTINFVERQVERGRSSDEITHRILPFLMNSTNTHERTVSHLLAERWLRGGVRVAGHGRTSR